MNVSQLIYNALHFGISKREIMTDYTVGELSDIIDIYKKGGKAKCQE